ncbi:MAG: class SAM-dependent methyltransferase [Flaviaesturariibacter sp.]|nr:class SAM-dependent methyltransferase [Flaviaesturariibacter sp.]
MVNQSTKNINDHFFEGQYKEVWRQTIPPGLTEAEVDFIQEIGDLGKGSRVLDIMCGYGRHALEMGRRGIQTIAIDNSSDYIREINQKAAEAALPVSGIQQNVSALRLEETFDAIICMGNSFAFFSEDEACALLSKLGVALQKGGKLIINTWMIAEIAIRHFKDREWHAMPDYKYLIHNRFLFQPARIQSVHTIIPAKGPIEEIEGVDYIFTLGELERLFYQAGFLLKDVYSTPRKKKFVLGDGRAYLVAEKQ